MTHFLPFFLTYQNVRMRGRQKAAQRNGELCILWGHGWGHSSAVFTSFLDRFSALADNFALDFPGFGDSDPPPSSWGTQDYAQAVLPWLEAQRAQGCRLIWVGHSFGARVGVRLAAQAPELLSGLVLIAGAGLPRQRSFFEKIRFSTKVTCFKLLKYSVPEGRARERLRRFFGSADYQNAGALRPVFLRVIREDLTEVAQKISAPTLLLYGSEDTETPPEIGRRYADLIPHSRYVLLKGYDHNTVLTHGSHQVSREIKHFVDEL